MRAPYRLAATKEPEPPDPGLAHEARLRARLVRARHVVSFVCGLVGVLSLLALAERPPPSGASARPPRSRADVTTTREGIDETKAHAYAEHPRSSLDALDALDAGLLPGAVHEADAPSR